MLCLLNFCPISPFVKVLFSARGLYPPRAKRPSPKGRRYCKGWKFDDLIRWRSQTLYINPVDYPAWDSI